jgi:hypothetical protein
MRRNAIVTILIVLAVSAFGLAVAHAQQKAAEAPEVFCNTMQAGALCPTGTVGIFKLAGPRAQQWLDAVNKYNAAVEAAAKQLKADGKAVLTPNQLSELDRWLGRGLNPQVNKLLAERK